MPLVPALFALLALIFGAPPSASAGDSNLLPYSVLCADYLDELDTLDRHLTELQVRKDVGVTSYDDFAKKTTEALVRFRNPTDREDLTFAKDLFVDTLPVQGDGTGVLVLVRRVNLYVKGEPNSGMPFDLPRYLLRKQGDEWMFYHVERDPSKPRSEGWVQQKECVFSINVKTGAVRATDEGRSDAFSFLPPNPPSREEVERAKRIRESNPGVPEV